MLVHLGCKITGNRRPSPNPDSFDTGPFVPLVTCTSVDAELLAKNVSQANLPVGDVDKFEVPMSGSCTINSFTNPRGWTIINLEARYETEGNRSNVSISGYFSGPQYGEVVQNGLTGCTSPSQGVSSEEWRDCPADEGGNNYMFRMEKTGLDGVGWTLGLELNGTWTCADRDPAHP
jgi:hypothetical protein